MFSNITIVGNVVRDAELRYTAKGTAVASTAIAINKKIGGEEKVSFIDIKFWGNLAEVAGKYLEKGKLILVRGA